MKQREHTHLAPPTNSCHGNSSPSDSMESVRRHFPPYHQLYFAVYLLTLSRTDSRQSDGLLLRQPVSLGTEFGYIGQPSFELERRLKLKVDEVGRLLRYFYGYNSISFLILATALRLPGRWNRGLILAFKTQAI